jgi:DNA uptake protein ComE-like DNA-binding protein
MNLNREPIKNWFGFTRRERRSTFIMLLIIILIIGFRYTIPESRIAIEDITGAVPNAQYNSELSVKDSGSAGRQFSSYPDIRRNFSKRPAIKKSLPQKSIIDINTSDSATLVKLPGIGPVLSARIIKYRHLLGGFARIDQLKEVYGLSTETFEVNKGRVSADSTFIARININSASYKELSHIHYLEKYEVTAILKYRELKGRINSISDLSDNKLITVEKAKKVSPYLNFGE